MAADAGQPRVVLTPPLRRNVVLRRNHFYRARSAAIFWVSGWWGERVKRRTFDTKSRRRYFAATLRGSMIYPVAVRSTLAR